MFGLRKTISTLLLVVAFLVLISLATSIYNFDTGQKQDMIPSELAQKGGEAVISAVQVSTDIATKDVQTNNGFSDKVLTLLKKIDWKSLVQKLGTSSDANSVPEIKEVSDLTLAAANNTASDSDSFVGKVKNLVKDEWDKSRESNNGSLESVALESVKAETISKFIDYQKTNEGAEIIFKTEHGEEFKIPLPFKFLSNSN